MLDGSFQSNSELCFGLSTVENTEKLDNPIFGGRWSWSLVVVAIRGRVLETPSGEGEKYHQQ